MAQCSNGKREENGAGGTDANRTGEIKFSRSCLGRRPFSLTVDFTFVWRPAEKRRTRCFGRHRSPTAAPEQMRASDLHTVSTKFHCIVHQKIGTTMVLRGVI